MEAQSEGSTTWRMPGRILPEIGQTGIKPNFAWFPDEQEAFDMQPLFSNKNPIAGNFRHENYYAWFVPVSGGARVKLRIQILNGRLSGEIVGGRVGEILGESIHY